VNDLLAAVLVLVGAGLMLLAGIGIMRMPDLFTRMQAATKAASLGSGATLLAVALHFDDLGISVRALLAIGFIFLTAPISAHMLARAAYFMGIPLWGKTLIDDLEGRYDRKEHRLDSPPWARR
jgi:multicomponent Na+:H+ antiporter subunit G